MTEPLLNIHHKYNEFDQSWTYCYSRGWGGATHRFKQDVPGWGVTIVVKIYDPLDHEERSQIYEQTWRITHKPGDLLYEHWYVDLKVMPDYLVTELDIEELQGMIDVLMPWQKICDSHNEENKQFAQVVDY